MENIQLQLNEAGRGAFVVEENGERLAEMAIGMMGGNMVIYHTEVSDKLAGKGVAKQLLTNAVSYARDHHIKIIALCPYVHAQFTKNPDQYADVWNKNYRS
ncbi:N-acetyltransferase [Rhodocytophaga rosea]|uniref:N-acetyltransferase n=1 Tax=Rhodocytophaga rosea TaxID=2704465 RepID=A0A6C0GTX0_9BACT|nr:N-acetyltransferase [Rhodocytophaga rosea]